MSTREKIIEILKSNLTYSEELYFSYLAQSSFDKVAKEIEKLYRDNIDLAYCAGIFNTGGIDVLGRELERLKHIRRKPSQIFQRYKPKTPIENVSDYLNECIDRATPNLSKIQDVDKELAEIRGEDRSCYNCKYEYPNYWGNPCGSCNNFDKWEPKTE